MQGRDDGQREFGDAESLAGHLLPAGSVFAFLAEHRQRLFPDGAFADLFTSGRGRPSIPADVIASVMVLQALHGLSDRQTAEAVTFDLRWKAACGFAVTETGFHPSVLTYWRRRICAISWVTVSWRATASSRIVEPSARRFLPASTPVAEMISVTASKTRCGRSLAAIRRRQYVNTLGWNPVSVTANPHAAFHRRSKVTASAVCRSDKPCNACNTITEAITSARIDGRPRPEVNRSANAPSGNNRWRCSAKNANTDPAGSRCPANDSASPNSRCPSSRPCIYQGSQPTHPAHRRHTFVQQSPRAPLNNAGSACWTAL